MIVRRFLAWSQTAPANGRAEAAGALARAWLHSDLSPAQSDEAEAALTVLLDDPSPIVRRALADALADAPGAPAHVMIALAFDQSDIAAVVLARSPLLQDSDLIDAAAIGDEAAQVAIACRSGLTPAVCGALSEIAGVTALIALLRNRSADVPVFAYRRMVERHAAVAELREAMLARRDLPVGVRHMLVVATADALSHFVDVCSWLKPERGRRVVAEAREAAAVAIADGDGECIALARHLRDGGHLTAGLLLRALLSGRIGLVEAALSDLAGQPLRRVAAILSDRREAGFAALYRRAGLPEALFPAFQAALAAWRDIGADACDPDRPATLSRRMIERTLTALEDAPSFENAKLLALLRRYEAEAAREDARAFVASLMHDVDDGCLIDDRSALAA